MISSGLNSVTGSQELTIALGGNGSRQIISALNIILQYQNTMM